MEKPETQRTDYHVSEYDNLIEKSLVIIYDQATELFENVI
jgi:hypothetical protein